MEGCFFAKIKSISFTFLNNVLSPPALCWLYMEKEEEEDLRNIWKSDDLMSCLKQHQAQRIAQGSEKWDVAKALMKNENCSMNQILFIFPSWSISVSLSKALSFPSSSCSRSCLWYTAMLAHFHKSACLRESGLRQEEEGVTKLGQQKTDSGATASFQLTSVPWKQLPRGSVPDSWGDGVTEATCVHPASFSWMWHTRETGKHPCTKAMLTGKQIVRACSCCSSTQLLQHFTASSGKGRRYSAMMLFPLAEKTDPQVEAARVRGICRFWTSCHTPEDLDDTCLICRILSKTCQMVVISTSMG